MTALPICISVKYMFVELLFI